VTDYVVDASVAIKWVIDEPGTAQALSMRRHRLFAPDLLMIECANVLWKKVRLKELDREEAVLASRLLARAEIELISSRHLAESATRLSLEIDHPAYDCVYLALAESNSAAFVTADRGLCRKARAAKLKCSVIHLQEFK